MKHKNKPMLYPHQRRTFILKRDVCDCLQTPGGEDSDSDMEDFRSVLEDSEMCLKVVDHSLKKKRSNSMGTGLASPGKYVSWENLQLLVVLRTGLMFVIYE